jgi:hypothetical protein
MFTRQKGNHMIILKWIKSLFNDTKVYESRLESFLSSKKPSSVVEIEHWITEFHRRGGIL